MKRLGILLLAIASVVGIVLIIRGQSKKADTPQESPQAVLANTSSDDCSTRPFAYIGLGQNEEAMKILADKVSDYQKEQRTDESKFYSLLRTLVEQSDGDLALYFKQLSEEWANPYPSLMKTLGWYKTTLSTRSYKTGE